MTTFIFTELQIIDIWLPSAETVDKLNANETFIKFKEHFSNFGVRIEPGIDLRLMGSDFYIKQTSQVKQQVPELAVMLEQCIETFGFNKCSVSW